MAIKVAKHSTSPFLRNAKIQAIKLIARADIPKVIGGLDEQASILAASV